MSRWIERFCAVVCVRSREDRRVWMTNSAEAVGKNGNGIVLKV